MPRHTPLGYTSHIGRAMLTVTRHKALLVLGIALLAVVTGCGGSNEVEIEARARVMAKAMVEATVQAA